MNKDPSKTAASEMDQKDHMVMPESSSCKIRQHLRATLTERVAAHASLSFEAQPLKLEFALILGVAKANGKNVREWRGPCPAVSNSL